MSVGDGRASELDDDGALSAGLSFAAHAVTVAIPARARAPAPRIAARAKRVGVMCSSFRLVSNAIRLRSLLIRTQKTGTGKLVLLRGRGGGAASLLWAAH